MRQFVFAAAAVFILVAGARTTLAGQITYSLQNYAADQNGSTLSGSVTTDGNLGTLTSADIVAWTWTVSPPVGAPFTLSGSGSNIVVQNLIATDQQLLLPELQTANAEFALLGQNADLEYRRDFLHDGVPDQYVGSPGTVNFWFTTNPGMGGTDPWVIGVATSSVPEPSGVVLLGLGITGFIVAGARRRFSRKQCN
jgi:PEP-CTERM motif